MLRHKKSSFLNN